MKKLLLSLTLFATIFTQNASPVTDACGNNMYKKSNHKNDYLPSFVNSLVTTIESYSEKFVYNIINEIKRDAETITKASEVMKRPTPKNSNLVNDFACITKSYSNNFDYSFFNNIKKYEDAMTAVLESMKKPSKNNEVKPAIEEKPIIVEKPIAIIVARNNVVACMTEADYLELQKKESLEQKEKIEKNKPTIELFQIKNAIVNSLQDRFQCMFEDDYLELMKKRQTLKNNSLKQKKNKHLGKSGRKRHAKNILEAGKN